MKKRSFSALILVVVLVGSILVSYKAFGIVMAVSSIIGFRELINIKYGEKSKVKLLNFVDILFDLGYYLVR